MISISLSFFSLYTFPISSLQFLLSDALFVHSSPSLSRSTLNNTPSQFRSSFPLDLLSICCLCQFFISHHFRMTSSRQTTPRQFLINRFPSLQPPLSVHPVFSDQLFQIPTILRTRFVSQTWTFSSCFSVRVIASLVHSMYRGNTRAEHICICLPSSLRISSKR